MFGRSTFLAAFGAAAFGAAALGAAAFGVGAAGLLGVAGVEKPAVAVDKLGNISH